MRNLSRVIIKILKDFAWSRIFKIFKFHARNYKDLAFISERNIFFFVRDFRSSLLPPVRPFAQLHAVWHTLAAIGSYYHVLFRLVVINLSPAAAFVEPYRVLNQKEYNRTYWFPFRVEKISSHTYKAGSWYLLVKSFFKIYKQFVPAFTAHC